MRKLNTNRARKCEPPKGLVIPPKKPEKDVDFIIPIDEWTPSVRKVVRSLQSEIKRLEEEIGGLETDVSDLHREKEGLKKDLKQANTIKCEMIHALSGIPSEPIEVKGNVLVTDETDVSKLIDIIHKMVQ